MPLRSDPPLHQPLVLPLDPSRENSPLMIARQWFQWLSEAIVDRVDRSPDRLAVTQNVDQEAALPTTALPAGTLAAGLYLMRYYARITRAASTSSSLTVTLAWEDGGVPQTETAAAMTGNTTATHQSGVLLVRADGGSALSFSTAYSSTGATTMQYRLDVTAELLFQE